MKVAICIHREKIGVSAPGFEIGECFICHQKRRYDKRDGKIKVDIIKLGRIDGCLVLPDPKERKDISPEEAAELETVLKEHILPDYGQPLPVHTNGKPVATEEEKVEVVSPKGNEEEEKADVVAPNAEEIDALPISRDMKKEIAKYASKRGFKEAEKKYGVPWRVIRGWLMTYSKKGGNSTSSKTNWKRVKKCRDCSFYLCIEKEEWCTSSTCQSRYPVSLRPRYRSPVATTTETGGEKEKDKSTRSKEEKVGTPSLDLTIAALRNHGVSELPPFPTWEDIIKYQSGEVVLQWLKSYEVLANLETLERLCRQLSPKKRCWLLRLFM